jgi:hypothetical protein
MIFPTALLLSSLLIFAALPVPPAPLIFDPKRRYTRKQIARVLTELGYPVTEGALQTMASRGGGPPYSRWGKWTLYTGGPSLDWAESRCRPVGRSTSERDATRNINP